MKKPDLAMAAVWCVIGWLSAHPLIALAETPLPPPIIHFCSANCFTLILKDGQYVREDGTRETWTIEHFSTDSVILHRHDEPAAWNGYKTDVIYAGRAPSERLTDLTVAGGPAPGMAMAWGAALGSVPANNAERDQPELRKSPTAVQMHMPLLKDAATSVGLAGARAPAASSAQPAGLAPPPAMPATESVGASTITRIHVLTGGAGIGTTELLTYTLDGAPVAPHIALGHQQSFAMAADARDVLYISHNNVLDYVVAAYRPDGTADPGFRPIPAQVQALAVSPAGNLYVLERSSPLHGNSSTGIVKMYNPSGGSVGAAIDTHVAGPTCLAVDAAGTLYVAGEDENVVETFDAGGRRLALTIKDGIARPMAIAVDGSGKVFVINANTHTLTTYAHDGQRTTPTINSFDNLPTGVALDASGRIYVGVGRKIGTYSPTGVLIKYFAEVPVSIRSIAVH